MDHNAGMRQGVAFPFFAGCQKYGRHGGAGTDTDGRHIRADILHRIINRHACRHNTAGAVDVKMDIFVGVFRFQKEKLGNNHVGGMIINGAVKKYNTVF